MIIIIIMMMMMMMMMIIIIIIIIIISIVQIQLKFSNALYKLPFCQVFAQAPLNTLMRRTSNAFKVVSSYSPVAGSSGRVIPCLILLIKFSLSRPACKSNNILDVDKSAVVESCLLIRRRKGIL